MDNFTLRRRPALASRRDAVVAASVIQWLATNVGSAWIQSAQAKVKEAFNKQLTVGSERRRKNRTDPRTPLQRKKAQLDAVRTRLKKSAEEAP